KDPGQRYRRVSALHKALKRLLDRLPDPPDLSPPPGLPQRPLCIGREKQIEAVLRGVLSRRRLPVPVLGSPGIGKSTVTLAALHRPRVVRAFPTRRFFVPCDIAQSGEALAAAIAYTLGLGLGPHPERRVIAELDHTPAVLVLDNLETPWEADT